MHTTQDYTRILHNTYFCNVKNKLSRGWKKKLSKKGHKKLILLSWNSFSNENPFQKDSLNWKVSMKVWFCYFAFFNDQKINSQTQIFLSGMLIQRKKIITKLTLLKSKWKREDTFTPKCRQKMHKSLTTGNFQRDFLPGGFFCQEILEDRHGGDVVRFEYRLSLSVM